MSFFSYLSSLIHVSDSLKAELLSITEELNVGRNEPIVEINNRCNDLFFIEKGLVRGFYYEGGKEITNWFAQEGEFATCFYSFIAIKPAFETIEALEDSILIRIPHAGLEKLYLKFPETERVGRIITEAYYIKLEERLLSLQFKNAKERYQNFVLSKPSLLQRASLGQIASYLGITQETLSRIRAGSH
ncbi:MAG: putative transcriptional regulator, Crp/Fnr family [Bacteroidota bacterium]|jgi:CRP-like cAMP-binding protein|nr:putative transcriptional regulator, Crp/Fnr family [Bacteroidota bacterium]